MVIGWDSKTDTYFISGLNDEQAMCVFVASSIGEILEKYPDITIISGDRENIIKTLQQISSGLHNAQTMKINRS